MFNTLDTFDISRDNEESNIESKNISQSVAGPIEALQSQNENKSINSDETLAQLVAMGFELSLAQIAVNENKDRGLDAILHWLLQQQSCINTQNGDNKTGEEIKAPIKQSTEKFHSENSVSKIKLAPYRRPISAASATTPRKGILKPPPPPNIHSLWKRDWLSTLNTRLQNVASATATPNFFSSALKRLNPSTTLSYTAQQEEQQQQQMPQHKQRQSQALHINATTPADQISQSNSQNSPPSPILTPKVLKRVRFSVAKLTDEYPHSPIPGESDNSDWEDEYDFWEWKEKQKWKGKTQPESEQKNGYTPKEMMQFYLAACKNREEFPVDRLADILRKASQPGGSLNVIDLTGDIIDRKIAEPMADILTLEFGLRKLIMERCEIEDDTIKIICHSLLVNDTLSYLNLCNNKRLRTNGFNYIAVYIRKSTALTYLDLSGINIDKKSATFLTQALIQGNNKSGAVLETLKLDNCGLKNSVLEVLGPGIRRSNLRNLSLRFNRINHAGAVWIGVMLRDYEDLNWDLDSVQLSPPLPAFNEQSGIQYIAQALRRNQSLKELRIQDNRIDSKGLVFLVDGLKYNHTLELFDLSRNPVGGPSSEGIIALRNGLPLNTTLKGLFLSNANLSTEGAIAIAEYLPETNSLIHLDLSANPDIDIAGIMALAVSIKMNHSVCVLDVNVQPNNDEMACFSRDILRACVRNTELAQKSDLENSENGFLLTEFETNPSGILDFNGSSEFGLGIYMKDLKKNVRVAKESLKMFEEMLESDNEKLFTENNEIINQLHNQCKNIQAKIRPYITAVMDKRLMEDLSTLNDNLSNALQKYEQIYNNYNEILTSPKTIDSKIAKNIIESNNTIETSTIPKTTLTSPCSSVLSDIKDRDFDNIALFEESSLSKRFLPVLQNESLSSNLEIPHRPRSPLEDMNKLLEVEEGKVLRKVKEAFEQNIEKTESNALDQLSGEELKLQLLDELKLD
ncbi:hypothetical protein C1645_740841 [Glomus cerebriforme]|uniref:RNI-like protein n=1 Tax=Glomus cerebriforme TaxID=658196 RepID=A0A397SJS8_9GLOM|nr:hypothetical protein C1645_740841 [Glomus cerebriforme]